MRKYLALLLGLVLVVCVSGSAFAQAVGAGAGYWPMAMDVTADETTTTDAVTGNAIMFWGECAVWERLGLGVFYSGLSDGAASGELFTEGAEPIDDEVNPLESATDSYTRVYASFDLLLGAPSLAALAGYVRTGLTLTMTPGILMGSPGEEPEEGSIEIESGSIGYTLSGYAAGASASADLGPLTVRGLAAYLFGVTGDWTLTATGTPYEGAPLQETPVDVQASAPVTATGLELMGAIGYALTPQLTLEAGYRYVSLSMSEGTLSGEVSMDGEVIGPVEDAQWPAMSIASDGFFVGLTFRF